MAKSNVISYTDFSGGINDTVSPDNLQDTELIKAINVELSVRGGFATRPGTKSIFAHPTPATDNYCTQLIEWLYKSEERLLAVFGGKLHRLYPDGTNLEMVTLKTGCTRVGHFAIKDKLYIGDGETLRLIENMTVTTVTATSGLQRAKIKLTITHPAQNEGIIKVQAGTVTKEIKDTVGRYHKVRLSIDSHAQAAGDVTVAATGATLQTLTLTLNETRTSIATKIAGGTYTGWTVTREGYIVTFTKDAVGTASVAYDTGPTGAWGSMVIDVKGVAANTTIPYGTERTRIAELIRAETFTGWTLTGDGYDVVFEADTAGANMVYYDPALTGAWGDIVVEKKGTASTNIFDTFKKCTRFLLHVNSMRIFGCGNPDDPTALYYSETGDPTLVKATSVMYPASSEGKITGIVMFQQSVLTSYNYSWWHFNGDDPEGDAGIPTATWNKLPIPYGCVNGDTIALTPQSFTFLGRNGLYSVSTNLLTTQYVATEGEQLVKTLSGDKVDRIIKNIDPLTTPCGVYHDNRYFLCYRPTFESAHPSYKGTYDSATAYVVDDLVLYSGDYYICLLDCTDIDPTDPAYWLLYLSGTAYKANTHILVYDWRSSGFVVYTGLSIADIARVKSELVIGTENYVLQYDSTLASDYANVSQLKKPIVLYVESKGYALGSMTASKFLNLVHIMMQQPQDIDVEPEADISLIADYGSINSTVVLYRVPLSESLIWGRSWGAVWGYSDNIHKQAEIKMIGSRFTFIIQNDRLDEKITFYGIGFQFFELRSKADRMMLGGLLE